MITAWAAEDAIEVVVEDFHVLRGLRTSSPARDLVKPPTDCWMSTCAHQATSDHRERWPTVAARTAADLRCTRPTVDYGKSSARDWLGIPLSLIILIYFIRYLIEGFI